MIKLWPWHIIKNKLYNWFVYLKVGEVGFTNQIDNSEEDTSVDVLIFFKGDGVMWNRGIQIIGKTQPVS